MGKLSFRTAIQRRIDWGLFSVELGDKYSGLDAIKAKAEFKRILYEYAPGNLRNQRAVLARIDDYVKSRKEGR